MKIIKSFESYTSINESKKDKGYKVGDLVRIEYWYLDEEDCPVELYKKMPHTIVKIIEKISNKSFKVTHNLEKNQDVLEHLRKGKKYEEIEKLTGKSLDTIKKVEQNLKDGKVSKINNAPDEIIKNTDIIDKFR
jgi:hypothetical protein